MKSKTEKHDSLSIYQKSVKICYCCFIFDALGIGHNFAGMGQ